MSANRSAILAAAVALVVGLWGGVTLAQFGAESARGPGSVGAQEALRSADAPRPGEAVPGGMAFLRARIDSASESPRACLEFSKDLAADGSVRYADYIRLDPTARIEATAAGKLLCLSGLPFEPDREVTIRQGLPAADGAMLDADETFTLSFGERPAFVGFAGQGVILPRAEADGLGVETVNVSRLKVEVLRVSDRNIARQAIESGQAVAEGSWSYWDFQYAGQELGAPVYEGEIAVDLGPAGALDSKRNQAVTTVFPLGAALKRIEPGAYVVKVEDASPGAGLSGEQDRPAAAYRWILYTDLALQTFKGGQGMDVTVRSLETAKPLKGVTLALVAQNNDELGRAKTDGQGRARFAAPLFGGEGGMRARYVLAYGAKGDFAALDLERSPIDLSERGVGGRAQPGAIDAYMFTDRGVYRPGETVRLSAMIRDAAGRAIEDRGSVLVLTRPNGSEAKRERMTPATDAGAVIRNIAIDRGAPRGRWRARLIVDGQEAPAGEVGFTVEDFVPQRLKVEAKSEEGAWDGRGERAISVAASFLYGAVGSGLPVQGDARLQLDPEPFPEAKDFQFGDTEDGFTEQYLTLDETATDGRGEASLYVRLPNAPATSRPMRARVFASVLEPGGRAVQETVDVPLRPLSRYLGLKPKFEGGYAGEGAPVAFEAIALDRAGRRIAQARTPWTLVEEDYGYDWYLEDGQWKWRRTGRDIPRNSGVVEIAASGAAEIALGALPSGAYRLILGDASAGEPGAAYRFGVGWGGGAGAEDTPDVVNVAPPTDPVKPGARVRLDVKAPYPGEAQVVVATDRVLSVRSMRLTDKPTAIEVESSAEWGAGAYVLVTVVTPRDPKAAPVPRRAVGAAYVPIDTGARRLEVALAPNLERLRPQAALEVPVKVKGAPRGEAVRMTLAAVDDGVLQITKYAPPNPVEHYFGKRALGVELRDDYGRLLNPNLGAPVNPNQGGDGVGGGAGLTVVPQKTVALWSGLVTLDRNGEGVIRLDAPDFNGSLHLMAVAWTESALGAADKSIIVRDPVVAELTLPRFLAPGDDAEATLSLDNVEGAAGDYAVSVSGTGVARLSEPPLRVRLAKGERKLSRVPVSADAAGLGEIRLAVSGPNGFSVSRTYPIEARAPFLPQTLSETYAQGAGQTYTPAADLFAGFAPGEGEAVISYSAIRGVDAAALIERLERYPYGCTEQMVSVAAPLLLAEALRAGGLGASDRGVRARVQQAVNTLLDRQSGDGAIGLWRADDRAASPWLGAYAVDFLRRAKAAGYVVPQKPLEDAYKGLRSVARLDDFSPVGYDFQVYQWTGSNDSQELLKSRAAAYALYVLAKAGRVDLGQVRYFHDAKLKDEPSPLARAQIGAALAHLGDRARAQRAFEAAEKAIGYDNTGDWYQTPTRDLAGVIALAAEAGQQALVDRLARRLERQAPDLDALTTQEQAALLSGAEAMLKAAGPVQIAAGGAAPAMLTPLTLTRQSLAAAPALKNAGRAQVFRTVTRTGPPAGPPPAASRGFSLTKRFFRLNGAPADPASLRQGERIVVVLSGAAEAARTHPAIAVDLLPAGLEIEAVLRPEDGVIVNSWNDTRREGAFGWVGEITAPKAAEARDDRFVAAADVTGAPFRFAYLARAVTPGTYTLPGAQIEDMYRPGVFARSAPGRIVIAPQNR